MDTNCPNNGSACLLLQGPAGRAISPIISTIGYSNLTLQYLLYINSFEPHDDDHAEVYYSITGQSINLENDYQSLKNYTANDEGIKFNENIPLPSDCDNITTLSIAWSVDASLSGGPLNICLVFDQQHNKIFHFVLL